MLNEIPQKYSIGYGIGGTGVPVSSYGLNVRLGGRCVGGMRIKSTGASPVYVLVNARIIGADFVDDNRIVPVNYIQTTSKGKVFYRPLFDTGLGGVIKYNSGAAGGLSTYSATNFPPSLSEYVPRYRKLTFGLTSSSYNLQLDASFDALLTTSYLKSISTTDALAIFPRGSNPNTATFEKDPHFEFPIVDVLSDNSIIIDAGIYGDSNSAALKTAPFDEGTGYATALILREPSSTSYDNRFYWFSPDRAITAGFPLNPGESIDLTSDPMIPQIFGVSAITQTGQVGAISVLQTKF